jgi:hypothetical protein
MVVAILVVSVVVILEVEDQEVLEAEAGFAVGGVEDDGDGDEECPAAVFDHGAGDQSGQVVEPGRRNENEIHWSPSAPRDLSLPQTPSGERQGTGKHGIFPDGQTKEIAEHLGQWTERRQPLVFEDSLIRLGGDAACDLAGAKKKKDQRL